MLDVVILCRRGGVVTEYCPRIWVYGVEANEEGHGKNNPRPPTVVTENRPPTATKAHIKYAFAVIGAFVSSVLTVPGTRAGRPLQQTSLKGIRRDGESKFK
jgi:hypothetical protein